MVPVPERVIRVMRMLRLAAEGGMPCPGNAEIAAAIEGASLSSGANAIALLETMNLIRVERFGASRIVTIVESGKKTAGETGNIHWRLREDGETPTRKRATPSAFKQDREEALARPVIDRTPCPRCGVRGDFGCSHRPVSQAAA
jgi:hypothetical protein